MSSLFQFRPGDKVNVVLTGAGYTTRDEGFEVSNVEEGVAYITDGENSDDSGYDARTGEWSGPQYGGFSRRIERV
jgi:hypothetical protein